MNSLKYCNSTTCQQQNPQLLSNFTKNRNKKDGLRPTCKSCDKSFRNKNKEKIKEWNFQNIKKIQSYRLSQYWPNSSYEQCLKNYNDLIKKQNNLCFICKQPETAKDKFGKVRNLCVDHDHKTGEVRSLLCRDCNAALGLLKENLENALNLVNYIKKAYGV